MNKGITIALILLGTFLVFGILAGTKAAQIKILTSGGEPPLPPSSVTATKVEKREWEESVASVGTVRAIRGVVVSPEVSGQVEELFFESGARAKAGDLLVRLDDSVEKAARDAAVSRRDLAEINLRRIRELRGRNTVAQSELDTAEALFNEAEAQLRNAEAALARKTIRAPFDGVLGIRQVDPGAYIGPGMAIVSIQDASEVFVDFRIPQRFLPMIQSGMEVRAMGDALGKREVSGRLAAKNSEIDSRTRSIGLRALFGNPDGALIPGMFLDVRMVGPETKSVLVIPQTAVLFAPFGDSVFLLSEEKPERDDGEASEGTLFAQQVFIRLGGTRGDFVEVVEGLNEGDLVADSGVFKLSNGSAVVVNNELRIEPSENPTPPNS
ncbi:MAG: efflux RND transporter periplasmic adaptor subunit [Puniceicoccaceae bacterium]